MTSDAQPIDPADDADEQQQQTFTPVVQVQINGNIRLILTTHGEVGLVVNDSDGTKSLFILGHGRSMLARLREATEHLLIRIN